MKVLTKRTPDADAEPFDMNMLKKHLRVEFDDEDASIRNDGWTAAAEIEQFAQVALLNQTITVVIFDPTNAPGIRLPIGPVQDDTVPTVTIDGVSFTGFDLVPGIRPYLRWNDAYHDLTPTKVVIEYLAGFGETASDIPSDLAQAIMDQTALHFDGRSPMSAKELSTSPHMVRIGARYRGVQI